MEDTSDERLVGAKDGDYIYECTRYVWWNNRQSSDLEDDRKFATRRMALLYVAKMNSDSFCAHLQAAGSAWEQLSAGEGQHTLDPNRPFDSGFLDLSDAILDAYGRGIALLFAVHKTQRGTVYECAPRKIVTTGERELETILGAPTGTNQTGCATASQSPHVGGPALAQAVRGGPPR